MVLPGVTPRPTDGRGVLPDRVIEVLMAQHRAGWSGTVTLNLKNGRIVAYEVTEKTRLDQPR